jgi:hypothetical protein
VVSFQHNRTRPFDGHAFYLDFTGALNRLAKEREFVDEHSRWSTALKIADEKDVARYVTHMNGLNDHQYFARQHVTYFDVIDGHQAHPQMDVCAQARPLDDAGRMRTVRATKWERVPQPDYSAGRYVPRSERVHAEA